MALEVQQDQVHPGLQAVQQDLDCLLDHLDRVIQGFRLGLDHLLSHSLHLDQVVQCFLMVLEVPLVQMYRHFQLVQLILGFLVDHLIRMILVIPAVLLSLEVQAILTVQPLLKVQGHPVVQQIQVVQSNQHFRLVLVHLQRRENRMLLNFRNFL